MRRPKPFAPNRVDTSNDDDDDDDCFEPVDGADEDALREAGIDGADSEDDDDDDARVGASAREDWREKEDGTSSFAVVVDGRIN